MEYGLSTDAGNDPLIGRGSEQPVAGNEADAGSAITLETTCHHSPLNKQNENFMQNRFNGGKPGVVPWFVHQYAVMREIIYSRYR